MRYRITWQGETFDTDTLTVLELETLEALAGRGYGEVAPLLRAGDFVALAVTFAMRAEDVDRAELMTNVATTTLVEIMASVEAVAD